MTNVDDYILIVASVTVKCRNPKTWMQCTIAGKCALATYLGEVLVFLTDRLRLELKVYDNTMKRITSEIDLLVKE